MSNFLFRNFRTFALAGLLATLFSGSLAAAVFAKYDGIDGESKDTDHDKWIDVLNVDWGIHKPGGGATGQSRRRGAAVVEDLTLTMEYEKSTPKLQEKCLKGEVIPKLEIEQFAAFDDSDGSGRVPYLRYELKNVLVSSYSVSATTDAEGTFTVVAFSMSFERLVQTSLDQNGEETVLVVDNRNGNATGNILEEGAEPTRPPRR